MADSHVNLQVHDCGLMISPFLSYLGASPDGIVSCECCGTRVLEVKCPYQCKEQSFKEASESCLELIQDSSPTIYMYSYYYQVQLQMKICELSYCYFVVWRPDDLVIIKIDYSNSFVEAALNKALSFFKLGVLPELVGQWYSRMT